MKRESGDEKVIIIGLSVGLAVRGINDRIRFYS